MALTPGALATAEGRCVAWAAGSWPQEGSMGRPVPGPVLSGEQGCACMSSGAIPEHDQQGPGAQPPCRHSDGPWHREQEQVGQGPYSLPTAPLTTMHDPALGPFCTAGLFLLGALLLILSRQRQLGPGRRLSEWLVSPQKCFSR